MDAASAQRMAQGRRSPALDLDDWDSVPPSKRKKLRRGTRSCWECKRRKMKCVFESPDDAVCVGCHRRWTKCVSQEFPEKVGTPLDNSRHLRDRLRRVESQLDQFLREKDDGQAITIEDGPGRPPNHGIPTPASMYKNDASPASHLPINTPAEDENLQHQLVFNQPSSSALLAGDIGASGTDPLSRTLYDALPSRQDTAKIYKASGGHHSIPFHEILTTPYNILERDGLRSQSRLLEIPRPNAHPVLIARHMLHLASFLQHLHPDLDEEIRGLSEPSHVIRERLADKAINLVTTNDKFMGSIEFLECIMITSLYQANCGYLRRSWVTARRAMAIAQSMGFHRPGARLQYKVLHPETKAYPHFMWFRIVFYDRQMCLLIGMPQGTTDRSMASDMMLAKDSASGRLERIHCVIASQILERNESYSTNYDYAWTQKLDKELQRSARSLPSRWWLVPNLSGETKGSQALFWEMRRLSQQLFHYNLLNQLHLPYMLRDSAERKFDYSRITCVNASREILSRFIMLRRWNQVSFSCRTIDFTALMAAMTLLLAHLNSHRSSQADNFLAAQYLGDRAMIEQAQENMEGLNRLNSDTLSARSAQLLRRLLAIEAKAAEGDLQSAQSVSVQGPETEDSQSDESTNPGKHVYIPYFGLIKAVGDSHADGMISQAQHVPPAFNQQSQPQVAIRTGQEAEMQIQSTSLTTSIPPDSYNNHSRNKFNSNSTSTNNDVTALFAPLLSEVLSDDPMQHFEYPGTAAKVDDNAFQDLDLTFLDNLLRGAGEDGQGGTEWAAA
ncbi:uncharacterized protein N7469_000598 [Penicillium citrinum]|uniref:Zn(2)-C6 fungal-type domain-containing protein n=2 Tax=Penicillium TaxID=5073 RepID=A0A9W9PD61_PENCI|nr:uncharacterized protein N7469_000598 [Penicillium citrinum]KAJ5242271.1 hypothetical protein N7469_000598 [Penicillium citrinum]